MHLSDILNILDIKLNVKDIEINKIRTDSRLVSYNDIFITINSGYKYIKNAKERGCNIIITDSDYKDDELVIIKVNDTIKVLGIIASYIRSKYNGTIIAVTGSCGKTTTKDLLTFILSSKYKVLSTKDSLNNHIGVPNTLLELDNSYDYVVLELGSNHIGEIKYLSNIARPNISIVTNVGYSHIGNFKTIENILKEKLSIGGLHFLNGEDRLLNNEKGIKVYKKDYNYEIIEHLKMNYYLVFRVCEYLNIDINYVLSIVPNFKLNKSRMEILKYDNIILIDDSYNASYDSVVAGLISLNKYNKKLIILGDMLELGDYSFNLHNKLNEYINNCTLLTLGKYTKALKSNRHFNNINKLNEYLCNIDIRAYDVIYIKGAHKFNLKKTVEIVKKILQKL